MSCCTACGGLSCRSGHSVGAKQATLKSMTICHSLDDLDLSFAESEVLQPQNSTLREDALSLELKDIFPQDLSAILGKLFKMYLFTQTSKIVPAAAFTRGVLEINFFFLTKL